MTEFPWLTALIVVPLVGAAVVWALPGGARRRAREVALGFSLLELGLFVAAFTQFDVSSAWQHQLVETHSWIPAFGVSYAVGVDGLGLLLIALAVFLVPLVLLAAWREQEGDVNRTRNYVALIL